MQNNRPNNQTPYNYNPTNNPPQYHGNQPMYNCNPAQYNYNPNYNRQYIPPENNGNTKRKKPSFPIILIGVICLVIIFIVAFIVLLVRPGYCQMESKRSIISKAESSYSDCNYLYSKRTLEDGWANRYDYFESDDIVFYIRTQAYLCNADMGPIPIRAIESRSYSNYSEQVLKAEQENIAALAADEIEIDIKPYKYREYQCIQIVMDDVSDAQACVDFIENTQKILNQYQPVPYGSGNSISGFSNYYYFETEFFYVITFADGTPIMKSYGACDAIGNEIDYCGYDDMDSEMFKEHITENFENNTAEKAYHFWN